MKRNTRMYFLSIIPIYNEHTKLILPCTMVQLNNVDGLIYYPRHFSPVTPHYIVRIHCDAGAYNVF